MTVFRRKTNSLPCPLSAPKHTYFAALDKGNQLQMEFGDPDGPGRLRNIDSILMVFLSDLKPFRDSLTNPLTTKRIDFLWDASDHKKMRIRQALPPDSTFLSGEGEPARLRLRQDAIYILLLSSRNGHTIYDQNGVISKFYYRLPGPAGRRLLC